MIRVRAGQPIEMVDVALAADQLGQKGGFAESGLGRDQQAVALLQALLDIVEKETAADKIAGFFVDQGRNIADMAGYRRGPRAGPAGGPDDFPVLAAEQKNGDGPRRRLRVFFRQLDPGMTKRQLEGVAQGKLGVKGSRKIHGGEVLDGLLHGHHGGNSFGGQGGTDAEIGLTVAARPRQGAPAGIEHHQAKVLAKPQAFGQGRTINRPGLSVRILELQGALAGSIKIAVAREVHHMEALTQHGPEGVGGQGCFDHVKFGRFDAETCGCLGESFPDPLVLRLDMQRGNVVRPAEQEQHLEGRLDAFGANGKTRGAGGADNGSAGMAGEKPGGLAGGIQQLPGQSLQVSQLGRKA